MKLTRRHLQQTLVLALDDLAETRIALAELGDRWRQARDLLDAERDAHYGTKGRLAVATDELAELRDAMPYDTVDRLASSVERDAASAPEVQP